MCILLRTTFRVVSLRRIFYRLTSTQRQSPPGEPQSSCPAHTEFVICDCTIELAFRLLKEYLGMSHWWSSKQELILVQIWIVLILSHLVYALRERIALTAQCNPFEVSMPLLVDLLPRLGSSSALQFDQLVQSGWKSGLLRASPRLELSVPQVELSCYHLAPPGLPSQRPGRAPSAPRRRAPKPATRVCGYQVQRQRRQASKQAKVIRVAQAKTAQLPMGVT